MTVIRTLLLAALGVLGVACSSIAGSDNGAEGAAFIGTTWSLVEVRRNDRVTRVDPVQVPLTVRFNDDGTAYGQVGCNRWNGRYKEQPDFIRLERAAASRRLCHYEKPRTKRLVDQYLATLQRASRYRVSGDLFTLRTARGDNWTFEPY